MKDILELRTDGVNLYLTLKVRPNYYGIFITILLIILLLLVPIFAFSNHEGKEMGSLFFGLVIMPIAGIIFLLKTLFWNLFGVEHLVLNSKTFSYQYEYGFFVTQEKTQKVTKLIFDFEETKETEEFQYGYVHLFDFDEETDLQNHIYKFNQLISEEDFDDLVFYYSQLVNPLKNDGFDTIHLN